MDGDEEEDGTDDLENEFDINDRTDPHHIAEFMLSSRLNIGHVYQSHVSGITTPSEADSVSVAPEIPLLTYGNEVD